LHFSLNFNSIEHNRAVLECLDHHLLLVD
jgi:hypothetical protein